jgi:pSer/pThr/pTyr-binding forkhead associated (FHA) protein
MKLSLLVLTSGKQEGKLLEIKLPQFLVGRDPQCHLRPASPLISKRHCAIIQRDDKAFIRDFDSTNGTFLNEEPVKGERELHHDDQLKIGPIMFTVRFEKDEPAEVKTPKPQTRAVETKTPVPESKAPPAKTPAPATKPVTKAAPSTPAPATKNAAGPDDDIAAMLLSLEEGEPSSASAGSDVVPEGSTVMDLQVPADVLAGGQPAGQEAKPQAKVLGAGDTRAAAARLLEKLTKRPRT